MLESQLAGLALRLDHLDAIGHDLQQSSARIEAHLTAIRADLDTARPLLDRWRNSSLARLATGRMPWG